MITQVLFYILGMDTSPCSCTVWERFMSASTNCQPCWCKSNR